MTTKLRVVRNLEETGMENEAKFFIVNEGDIEFNFPECECYNRYGQKIGCNDAGCYSPENSESDFQEGDEEMHRECDVINYWDGNNWKSFFLENDCGTEDGELLPEDDQEAIQILKEFEEVNFVYNGAVAEQETEHYTFTNNLYSNFFIAMVE